MEGGPHVDTCGGQGTSRGHCDWGTPQGSWVREGGGAHPAREAARGRQGCAALAPSTSSFCSASWCPQTWVPGFCPESFRSPHPPPQDFARTVSVYRPLPSFPRTRLEAGTEARGRGAGRPREVPHAVLRPTPTSRAFTRAGGCSGAHAGRGRPWMGRRRGGGRLSAAVAAAPPQ